MRKRESASIESLESRLLLAVAHQPTGPLSGKIVYTVGGHGIAADYPGTGAWATQRGDNNGIVEDFGNQDQLTYYVNYLFNAGATVVPLRPVGNQPNEVVLDNNSAVFSGTWTSSKVQPYFGTGNDAVGFKTAQSSVSETATAKYTPNIPKTGFYPVYAWASDGADRLPDQTYRITYSGGSIEVKVNHQRVGKGWVYLGTYYMEKGQHGFVEVSNKSTKTGVAVADAIRFGNGMGDIDRGAGKSGLPREDEATLYWIIKMAGVGTPKSAYYGTNSNDRNATVSAPARYAAYMNNEAIGAATDRVFLSFHTNAGGGTARGTLGLLNGNNNPDTATPHQLEWATMVATEVSHDLVSEGTKVENPWANNTTLTLDRTDIEFGEINNLTIGSEFDATIVEVGYHDNVQDAQDLLDPKVRNWVGRAAYQATVKYFNKFASNVAVNLLPEPAQNVRAVADSAGNITVSWSTPATDSAGGQSATGYIVQTSTTGLGFDEGRVVSGGSTTSLKISGLSGNQVYYFRVIATNAGGRALASEVVAARPRSGGTKQVLIVNAFDRLDRFEDQVQTGPLSTGGITESWFRVRQRFNNSRDYVSLVAEAVEAFGPVAVDSCQNEAIANGQVKLGDYKYVIWLDGEEGVKNETFSSAERTAVTNYLNANGKMFISGSEIGFDLVGNNKAKTFFTSNLHANYVADDANSHSATGVSGSIFAGLSFGIDDGTGGTYDVDAPDKISPGTGAKTALNYSGTGSGGAAIQYSNSTGQKLVLMGFPFETITSSTNRNAVMKAVLQFFGAGPSVPTGLTLAGGNKIHLDWKDNPETNIGGYNVYRSRSSSGPFEKINSSLAKSSTYVDSTIGGGKTYYYRVTAVTTNGLESAQSSTVSGRVSTLMVNAGGGSYTDLKGNVWSADNSFSGGTASTTGYPVSGTSDDPLYSNRRFGKTFTYSFAVANGDYQLKLYFADPTYTSAGKRKFDVLAEGTTILDNFDIAASGGGKTAIVKTFNVSVQDGRLSLLFDASVDNAIISAIELI